MTMKSDLKIDLELHFFLINLVGILISIEHIMCRVYTNGDI